MNIILIGSGNVATVLGRMIVRAGHRVPRVYSRNRQHALRLAGEIGAEAASGFETPPAPADLYLLAVPDDAIPEVAASLQLGDIPVAHTAGSVSRDALK